MTYSLKSRTIDGGGITAPLRHLTFRRIWLASVLANVGALIRSVGAAWAMTQMTSAADKVALVQTALMLPVMLISIPAGAIADMHDRRTVALVSVSIALAGATALTALAWLGLVTPNLLLALCFVVGTGMALMDPAWQSSVSEQVPLETLPAAVALNSISYNIARSVGPAIGGIMIVLVRSMVTGVIGGGIIALMPLVARDHGGAQTYGTMLSAFGMGAIVGALNITEVRKHMSGEAAIRACALSMAGAITAVGLSSEPVLTAVALFLAGAVWIIAWALFNIGVQLSAPRWVAGRSLAAYQAAGSGGIAVGSWAWGSLADATGVQTALLISAGLMMVSPLLGLWLRMPRSALASKRRKCWPILKFGLSYRDGVGLL